MLQSSIMTEHLQPTQLSGQEQPVASASGELEIVVCKWCGPYLRERRLGKEALKAEEDTTANQTGRCIENDLESEECPHRRRQERVVSILQERGGSMRLLGLLDYLIGPEVGFSEDEAVQALNDDPPKELDINRATGLVQLRESVAA
mgnify:CR=1 FL=1